MFLPNYNNIINLFTDNLNRCGSKVVPTDCAKMCQNYKNKKTDRCEQEKVDTTNTNQDE